MGITKKLAREIVRHSVQDIRAVREAGKRFVSDEDQANQALRIEEKKNLIRAARNLSRKDAGNE